MTFRQIDPLYTLDLSNPQKPAVLGELRSSASPRTCTRSASDLLLGLGQDANEQGQTQGTQLSLFDVSDLSAPEAAASDDAGRVHELGGRVRPPRVPLLAAHEAHRRAAERLPARRTPFNGAVGFRVERDKGISSSGAPTTGAGTIMRSLVAQGRLFTVSDTGVLASTLDTLAPVAFTPF